MATTVRGGPPKPRPVLGATQTLAGVATSANAGVIQTAFLKPVMGPLTSAGLSGIYQTLYFVLRLYRGPSGPVIGRSVTWVIRGPIGHVAGRSTKWVARGPIGHGLGRFNKRLAQALQIKSVTIIGHSVTGIL